MSIVQSNQVYHSTHFKPANLTFSDHLTTITGLAFDAEIRRLASADGDGTIHLWEIGHPQQPAPLAPLSDPDVSHSTEVWGLVFSPDGQTLASSGVDATSCGIWRRVPIVIKNR